MAYTFGAATTDDISTTGMFSIATSSAFMVLGWFRPTTLTAGRAYWGMSTLTCVQVHTTTSELSFRVDRTTDAVHNTSGAGIVVDKWHFIAFALSTFSGTPVIRCWIGTEDQPPTEVTVTVATAGSGAIPSVTVSTVGNSALAASVAFQGQIGQVTEAHFTPSLASWLVNETSAAITQAEADHFLQNVVIPHWLGQPRPHLIRGTNHQFLLWDLESNPAMIHVLQGGTTIRLGPEQPTVNGATWSEIRQPRGIILAWPDRNHQFGKR